MATKQTANINVKPGLGSGGMRSTNTVVFDVVRECEMRDSNKKSYSLKPKEEFKVWLWGDSTYRAETNNIPTIIDRAVLCDLETAGMIRPRDPKNSLVMTRPEISVAAKPSA